MSTDSTTDLENQLRTRLLSYLPIGGFTLADVLGQTGAGAGSDGKLFWDAAPDNLTGRWGVLQLKNRRSDGDGQEKELVDLEVMFFARPRSQKATLEQCADLCDQAMLRYREDATGTIACWSRLRSTLPPFTAPADAEVVQIRCVYTLALWPAYLTQYRDA